MPGPTLEQLEREVWLPPEYHSSLVENCHRLRKKPVADLTPAELRLLIGQQIGLLFLVPRALDVLEGDPLIDAYYYPGDLLASIVEAQDWLRSQPIFFDRVTGMARRAIGQLDPAEELYQRLRRFLEATPTPQ